MKSLVPLVAALCTFQISATAQESGPAAAAQVAYEYLHSPERDKEIEWLRSEMVKTPKNPDEAALDLVTHELTSDLERLLTEQRQLTQLLEEPSFFDLKTLTSKELVSSRYETIHRYVELIKKNTVGEWQQRVTERLSRSGASEEAKKKFLANFMAGMEQSFTERLTSMGYADKDTFGQDLAESERELLWWQEIFKMLQDTDGRWRLDPATNEVVFKSELETSQFKKLWAKVAPQQ